jgi:hypothetical protein
MGEQVNQLSRTAVRTVVCVACAAVLSCGEDDASTREPTQIVGQPQNQAVAAGATATFSIQLAGEPPLSINWTKGGVRIPGATATRYTTPPTVPSDDGLTFGVALAARDASGVPVNIDSKMASLTVVPAEPAVPGVFTTAGSLVMARAAHSATLLSNGKVLIVGGGSPANSPSAAAATSAELYDPATNAFTETGSTTGARRGGHSATLLRDGRVLVCGGSDLTSIDGRSDAEIYDTATGRFSPAGSMGTARSGHAAVLLSSGKVLVAGGFGTAALNAELFNPATGTFSPTSSLVRNRFGATGVLLVDGRVLVFGYDAVSELYEPANGLFTAGGSAQTSSGLWLGPSLAMLPDDRVLAVSGKEPGPPPTNLALVANARLFDPATSDFILARALIWPRAGSTATRLPDGRVLVFGGEGDGRWPDRGELYDPFTGLFGATVSAGTGRVGHSATLLQNGKVLIAGGQAGISAVSDSSPAKSLLFEPM